MTPLVLLPGMMCDARLFAQIAAFSGRRAVQTAPIGARDTMQALAAGVLADAPPKFALAGLRMGGIVYAGIEAAGADILLAEGHALHGKTVETDPGSVGVMARASIREGVAIDAGASAKGTWLSDTAARSHRRGA